MSDPFDRRLGYFPTPACAIFQILPDWISAPLIVGEGV